jgi:xanthine dehydrogenase molybdenum-binding subunit
MSDQTLTAVGQRIARLNGPDIVTGRTTYADDIRLPGMLHGRVLRSPHAHARIRSVNIDKARRLPGVVDILTAAADPGTSLFARKEACYEGQKVALVIAEDPDIAEDALQLIDVDYKPLPSVTDPYEAMSADAPPVILGAATEEVFGEDGRRLSNIAVRGEHIDGDVAAAFAAADAIVEAEYRAPYWHQTYLEPNSCTARAEPDGRITLWTSCQGSFSIRDAVSGALQIGQGRIRVIPLEMGGGFGAKNGPFLEAHAVLGAMRTGRPVKILMSREEEFIDGRPAPGCWVRLKTAGRKDGTITAVEGRIAWDGGVSGRSGAVNRLIGPYLIENVKLEGLGVRTNKPAPGAFRAPGAPQMALARESNIDMLARELGIDPIELRMKNAVGPGDRSPTGAPIPYDWLRDTLQAAADTARWGKRKLKPNQGVGIACGDWRNASGATNAFVTIAADGSVSVLTGQVDITGVHTVMAQIVAEELHLPVARVQVTLGDTDKVPYTSLSAGSKAAYSAGTAAKRAAEDARRQLLSVGAEMLEVSESDVDIGDECVFVSASPTQSVSVADIAATAQGSSNGPISGTSVVGSIPSYAAYAVNIATVEVDPETGSVKLIDLVAAQDVGKALNPMLVEGQIEGGAIQSVAYALMEGMVYDDQGRVANPNLLDYAIPTITDVPRVKTVLVETPCQHGPYGAKGVGEPPIIPGAAAIVNAIYDAVGVRVTQIPITPERLVKALREKEGQS